MNRFNDTKRTNYKMYKKGKFWVFSSALLMSIAFGGVIQESVSADTNSTPVAQTQKVQTTSKVTTETKAPVVSPTNVQNAPEVSQTVVTKTAEKAPVVTLTSNNLKETTPALPKTDSQTSTFKVANDNSQSQTATSQTTNPTVKAVNEAKATSEVKSVNNSSENQNNPKVVSEKNVNSESSKTTAQPESKVSSDVKEAKTSASEVKASKNKTEESKKASDSQTKKEVETGSKAEVAKEKETISPKVASKTLDQITKDTKVADDFVLVSAKKMLVHPDNAKEKDIIVTYYEGGKNDYYILEGKNYVQVTDPEKINEIQKAVDNSDKVVKTTILSDQTALNELKDLIQKNPGTKEFNGHQVITSSKTP